jgi:hypothetical protein
LLGVEVSAVDTRDADQIERGLATFARSANGGLIVMPGQTASVHGCPYRKSNPHVLMVQSTKHRPHFDAPRPLDVPPNGRIFAQR